MFRQLLTCRNVTGTEHLKLCPCSYEDWKNGLGAGEHFLDALLLVQIMKMICDEIGAAEMAQRGLRHF